MTDPLPGRAALATLGTIHLLMLFALYTKTAPHPPEAIPPFALGPFLTAAIAAMVAAFFMAERKTAGPVLAIVASLLATVSLGPHKYLDPAFPLIWPAVITGQIAIVTLLLQAVRSLRASPATASHALA